MKRTQLQRTAWKRRREVTQRIVSRDRGKAWRLIRHEVYERDGGVCVLCHRHVPWDNFECHHRLLRSRGGCDNHDNLITLHGNACHAVLVHHYPAWSVDNGFMVPSHREPGKWPVAAGQVFWLPGVDGWTLVHPHADQQASVHPVRAAA